MNVAERLSAYQYKRNAQTDVNAERASLVAKCMQLPAQIASILRCLQIKSCKNKHVFEHSNFAVQDTVQVIQVIILFNLN